MAHPVSAVLRPLTQEERSELQRVKHASSEPHLRHQRAVALLAIAEGASRIKAAQQAGWSTLDPVRKIVGRFNEQGLGALNDHPRRGRAVRYGAAEKARILQEACRTPDRAEDATAPWSLSLLQRALRKAPDGLPQVSTFTILHTLHEAGYRWQKSRSWCHTGRTLKKGKDGKVYQSDDPYMQEKKR